MQIRHQFTIRRNFEGFFATKLFNTKLKLNNQFKLSGSNPGQQIELEKSYRQQDTNAYCCNNLVEKNIPEHYKKQFAHIQRITCLGMSGCTSTTLTAIEGKQAYRPHYSVHFVK
jgi:hypothetical protein